MMLPTREHTKHDLDAEKEYKTSISIYITKRFLNAFQEM